MAAEKLSSFNWQCGKSLLDFLFFFNIYLFAYYVYSILSAVQKRAPGLISDSCEPPCGCWELNSGPLEEQAMLLTAEPSLQPLDFLFYLKFLQTPRHGGICL